MDKRKFGYVFLLLTLITLGCSRKASRAEGEKIREYANALYNRGLYVQAVETYQRYLDFYPTNFSQKANITFTMANIYFERIHDYETALALYLKVKHVYPEKTLLPQVDQQIVACLERLGRSHEAQQALEEAVALEPKKSESHPGKVIARIGDRPITQADLDYHLRTLPPYLQEQFKDKKGKLEFLRQYIATELFYDAAKRKGLEKDKEVIEGTFQAKKNLMVQKYLQEEIASQIKVATGDLQLYYKAHPEKYAERDAKGKVIRQKPFEAVQKQVEADYIQEKQQQAIQELLSRMMHAEKVEIYEDLVE